MVSLWFRCIVYGICDWFWTVYRISILISLIFVGFYFLFEIRPNLISNLFNLVLFKNKVDRSIFGWNTKLRLFNLFVEKCHAYKYYIRIFEAKHMAWYLVIWLWNEFSHRGKQMKEEKLKNWNTILRKNSNHWNAACIWCHHA